MSKIQVRGIEIGYDEVGSGTPVVLLHGFPFNRTMWDEQFEALRGRHRVIAPDLRGHGETTATNDPVTMEEMAKDVAALSEKINISRAAVCGLSMGGYVALALYRMFPLRARALVLAILARVPTQRKLRKNREAQAGKALKEGMAGYRRRHVAKTVGAKDSGEESRCCCPGARDDREDKPEGAAAACAGWPNAGTRLHFSSRIVCPTLVFSVAKT